MSDRKPPHLLLLVMMSAISPLALNIFMPSMPGIMKIFEAEYSTVQLTLTFYLTAIAVAQLFIGGLSDRFGRRPVVLWGMTGSLLGSGVCIFAQSIEMLIIGRVIQAAGSCTGMVMSRAIIRDMHGLDKSASMMGYVATAMVVAPMLAPSIGGLLDGYYGWQSSFILVFAFAVLLLVISIPQLGETHVGPFRSESPVHMLMGFGHLLKQIKFMKPALQISFSTAVFFSFLGGAPYVVMELMGGTPVQYGLYFMVTSFCYMSGNFTTGRYSEKWGTERLISLGLGFGLMGGIFLLLLHFSVGLNPISLFAGMGFIAIGNGMSLPTGTASAISADPTRVGSAAGLSGSMQLGVGALASYFGGAFLSDSVLPMIIIMAVSTVLAIIAHGGGSWLQNRARRLD